MSMTPARYQPTQRLIDDPERLEELYCEQGMTIREIENLPDVNVGRTSINTALDEYDIQRENACGHDTNQSHRGTDPPSPSTTDVDWSAVQ
jgi:hypothetical protein